MSYTPLKILIAFYVLLLVLLVTFIVFYFRELKQKNEEIRSNIFSGEFIYYKNFENNWIIARSGRRGVAGYKYNDTSGCYVITIYDKIITDNNFMDYNDVYVGQSVHICQRVHSHFNGKGNGNVFADIKYGKHVYVRLVPCAETEMNELEKELIRAFDATKSYNATRGGGTIRV